MATSSSLVKTHSLPTTCSNCLIASAKSPALTPGGIFISCPPFDLSWRSCPSRSRDSLSLPHRFRPYAALARGQDAVGIERVFDVFVQAPQPVVVGRIRVRDIAHERGVRAVFAPAMLGRRCHQAAEDFAVAAVFLH